MGESDEIRARAAIWRLAARESRGRARRVSGLSALRWDAPAADAFRARLGERAAGLLRLADLEEAVGSALDELAAALEAVRGDAGGAGGPAEQRPGRRGPAGRRSLAR